MKTNTSSTIPASIVIGNSLLVGRIVKEIAVNGDFEVEFDCDDDNTKILDLNSVIEDHIVEAGVKAYYSDKCERVTELHVYHCDVLDSSSESIGLLPDQRKLIKNAIINLNIF